VARIVEIVADGDFKRMREPVRDAVKGTAHRRKNRL
jgi:hypothetical protein